MTANKPWWIAAVIGWGLLQTIPARASLGGDAASIAADAAELLATARSVSQQRYEVQVVAAPAGVEVREYLRPDGIVFAVAWTGPIAPNLARLLGEHYPAYATALASLAHPGLHRVLRVATDTGLVVEAGGHLRAYRGRAYLSALVPVGVSIDDLN